MPNAKRLSASVFCLVLFLGAGVAKALPISDVLFSRDTGTGPKLERVGFDGTSFIGSSIVLSELNPEWMSMSYDAAAGFMYFTRISGESPTLQRVGFDGSEFIGSATVIAELNPDWAAMSLVYRQASVVVTEPATIPLFALGVLLLGLARTKRRAAIENGPGLV